MRRSSSHFTRAFSLLELLTAMAVLSILVLLLASITTQISETWIRGEGHIQKRRNSRAILDYISSDLRSACVPPVMPASSTQSTIQFVLNPPTGLPSTILNPSALFWTAPVATTTTYGNLAEIGYFVRYGTDSNGQPTFQLCRFFVNPTTGNDYQIYNSSDRYAWIGQTLLDQYTDAQSPSYHGLFAENVIVFCARCLDPVGNNITLTAQYTLTDGSTITSQSYNAGNYDSMKGYRYTTTSGTTVDVPPPALPASVEISVVILDSKTAKLLTLSDAQSIIQLSSTVKQSSDIPTFLNSLPEKIRNSARSFTTKVDLANTP